MRLILPLIAMLAALIVAAPASAGTLGNVYGSNGLANIEIGRHNRQVDYRFRADGTGTLGSVTVYFIHEPGGYFAGNGGDIRVTLEGNNTSNEPNGVVLGSGFVADPTLNDFRTIPMSGGNIVKGQLYHLRFTDVDPNPTVNWVSLDDLWYPDPPPVPREPTISDLDLAGMFKDPGQSWQILIRHVPIFALGYTNGTKWGPGAPYVLARVRTRRTNIGGPNKARETITPKANVTASGAHFRLSRVATAPSPLTVSLVGPSGTLRSGTVAASAIPTNGGWANVKFSSPVALTAGTTYSLQIQSPASASTAYVTWPLEEGPSAFVSNRMFRQGVAQWSTNGGSTWSTSTGDDWQAYLDTQ